MSEGEQKAQAPSYEMNKAWEKRYSTVNTVSGTVIALHGDRW